MHSTISRLASILCVLLVSAASAQAGPLLFEQTNLVTSDQNVVQAEQTNANLINPWGLSESTGSPLWVSGQLSGKATVYTIHGTTSSAAVLTVPIPNQGGAAAGASTGPTGQVSTGQAGVTTQATDFQVSGGKAAFIFANLDGSISAWRGGLSAASIVVPAVQGASFTGLAIGNLPGGGAAEIFAADQNSGNIDVFKSDWSSAGSFTDPNLPAGFTAFNVQNLGGNLFVTFANPNNPLGGVVDEFTTGGTLVSTITSDVAGTHVDSPWGVAIAPTGWGQFAGDLLVGNNGGDGTINAFSLGGVWQGQVDLGSGQPFSEQQLWGLTFGNGGSGGSPNVLYFAAGFDAAGDEGLLGALTPAPEPSSVILAFSAVVMLAGRRLTALRRRQS